MIETIRFNSVIQYFIQKSSVKLIISIGFLVIFLQNKSFSQILDDSTKQVYGVKTVGYILEEDILNNRKTLYHPDTTLENFHYFDFKLRNKNLFQDLGNFGTATKNIFFQPISQIGKPLGFNVFSPYSFDSQQVTYFNTRSPYTNMNYVQANRGSGRMWFTHSQNINPQLNVTLDVRRLTASKQYGTPQTSEDRMVDSWAFMLHSNYESKNKKYIVLGNYNHFNHKPNELGGILPLDATKKYVSEAELGNQTNFKQFSSYLTSAFAREYRNDLHLYQQYALSNGFQVFHVLDSKNHKNFYNDNLFRRDSTNLNYYFLKNIPTSATDTLRQDLRYHLLENKFGLKGIYRGFAYRLHLRNRFYNLTDRVNENGSIKLKNETIVGGWANYYFPDSLRRAYAEVEMGSGLDYSIKSEYISPNIRAGFHQISSQPTLIDERFYSLPFTWNRGLKNQFSTTLYGNFMLNLAKISLSPTASYTLINNYIYYNQQAQVSQTSLPIHLFRAGIKAEYKRKKWYLMNESFVTTNTKPEYIRMPAFVNNTQVAFQFVYAKVLHINMGVDVYYRTRYKGDNYMPLTRQFFLQDNQYVWGKPSADVFADMKINRVRLFFKYANLPYGILPTGYYVSSTYPALRNTFIMGVNWPLFD